ncbi:hypothetical protein M1N17_01870 [Dehalococcoidia bacterium]|nr:hypothetical protein [Dehalococcoidia bacterium]
MHWLEIPQFVKSVFCSGSFHLRYGWRQINTQPRPFLEFVFGFAFLSALAAFIDYFATPDTIGSRLPFYMLNIPVVVFASPCLMLAVQSAFDKSGKQAIPVLWSSLPWVGRYLYTNAHSSVVFWVPIGLLYFMYRFQSINMPVSTDYDYLQRIVWGAIFVLTGIYLHTRTALAPYLAIHNNIQATLAITVSFRLSSGGDFWRVLGVLLFASIPPIVVMGALLGLGELFGILHLERVSAISLHFIGLVLQGIRLLLIPSLYSLHQERYSDSGISSVARGVPYVLRPFPWFSMISMSMLRRLQRVI